MAVDTQNNSDKKSRDVLMTILSKFYFRNIHPYKYHIPKISKIVKPSINKIDYTLEDLQTMQYK